MLLKALNWLRTLLFSSPAPCVLEEQRFPRGTDGAPDLACFTRPVDHYIAYIEDYLMSLEPSTSVATLLPKTNSLEGRSHAYQKGVVGQWGLIARGPKDALPYILSLLERRVPEARQAAAAVLEGWLRRGVPVDVSAQILAAAEREGNDKRADPESLSALLLVLGRLKHIDALPLFARVLRAPDSRVGDLDWSAAEAIASTAGGAISREGDLRRAADLWLQKRGV